MTGFSRIVSHLVPGVFRPRWRRFYSQEGEDVVLVNFFGDEFRGIYVDIGAHDPIAWSNTKKLADRGWRGLNIDPRPGLAERFRKQRPHDVCLEVAIDIGAKEPVQYWMFDAEPRWNCLSPTEPSALKDGRLVRPSSHHPVPVLSIEEALDRANLDHVDFVNIDIEGGEAHILRHWPWERYLPKAICVDVVGKPAAEVANTALTRFLAEKGLVFTSQLVCSAIYLEREFLETRYPADPEHTHFDRACLRQSEMVQ
jgi:FkbM family methyltransferase